MQSKLYDVSYCKYSGSKEETNKVNWVIHDFTWLANNQTNREIRTTATEEQPFQLKMKFVGKDNGLVEFYYQAPATAFLKCSLYIKHNNYRENSSSFEIDYKWVPANEWQLVTAQTKKELLSVVHTITKLTCIFEFLVNQTSDNNEYNNNEDELDGTIKPQLNTDLEKLLLDPLFSDVKIKSVEGVEVHAHKILLITRSTVFKAHFEHNTVETLTNVVDSPLETEVLKEVLSYIYTDKTPKLDEMATKMLIAADFYQLTGLIGLCEEALHKKLCVENAIETLELANLYAANNLKRLTLGFIHDGQAKDVIKTKGWESLQSTELIKIIYEYSIMND